MGQAGVANPVVRRLPQQRSLLAGHRRAILGGSISERTLSTFRVLARIRLWMQRSRSFHRPATRPSLRGGSMKRPIVVVFAALLVTLGAVAAVHAATIIGTSGPDRIVGTNSADNISALGDDDRVVALGGDDQINGGSGDDTLAGDGTCPPGATDSQY